MTATHVRNFSTEGCGNFKKVRILPLHTFITAFVFRNDGISLRLVSVLSFSDGIVSLFGKRASCNRHVKRKLAVTFARAFIKTLCVQPF